VSIPIRDVVSVSYPKRKSSSPLVTPPLTSPQHTQQIYPVLNQADASDDNRSLTINYAKRKGDPKVEGGKGKKGSNRNVWRIHSITLDSSDKYIIKEWHDSLNNILHGEGNSFSKNICSFAENLISN
jgi:hypothetical protein